MNDLEVSQHSVVIYDLDGVIIRNDSFASLLAARLRSSPRRLLRAGPSISAWAFSRDAESRARVARRLTAVALSGMRDGQYGAMAETMGARIGASRRWVRADVVARIRRQHAEGKTIVIATATEARLASALLVRARVPFDHLSASELAQTATGMVFTDHRVGSRKAEALVSSGIDLATAEFATDSGTDLPTARRAGHVVLVGAGGRTRAEYERAGIRYTELSA